MIKRIVLHWTAGTNQPSSADYNHYHYMINGDGLIVKGKHSVLDNENCNDGVYAAMSILFVLLSVFSLVIVFVVISRMVFYYDE